MAGRNERQAANPRRGRTRRGLPGSKANDIARVGVRELRQNLSVYLDRVKEGETLSVTEHGAIVAVLAPPITGSVLDRMVADGRAVGPRASLRNLPAPRPAPLAGPSSENLFAQLRDERLS